MAFRRAKELDPSYLGVLLSMGVSYANELEEGKVVETMMEWLGSHPDHKKSIPSTQISPGKAATLRN